jgi:hypothetical protein
MKRTRNTVQLHTKCIVLPLVCCSSLSRFPKLVIVKILSVLFEASRPTGEVRRLARLWIFGDLPKTEVKKICSYAFCPSGRKTGHCLWFRNHCAVLVWILVDSRKALARRRQTHKWHRGASSCMIMHRNNRKSAEERLCPPQRTPARNCRPATLRHENSATVCHGKMQPYAIVMQASNSACTYGIRGVSLARPCHLG